MKDANELLVAQGPEGFVKTWTRLYAETSGLPRQSAPRQGAPVPVPLSPVLTAAREPEPPRAAAKGEDIQAVTLALDEAGTYLAELGPRTWRVRGLSAFGVDRLRVNLRVDQGARFHVDTFDLYSARSRHSFIEASVRALHLEKEDETAIADEIASLIVALEKERLALRKQGTTETKEPVMSSDEREDALAFLRAPDLVDVVAHDFEALGCVGEREALLVGLFALISRKLDEPLSILFCARSGAGKSVLQDTLCELVPPEDLAKYTRISGQVLFYKDEHALVRKILAVDEEDGASSAAYAIRSLLSTGELRSSITRTDPKTGRQVAEDYLVRGPASVLMTSAHPEILDYETRNRFVLLTVDESREQTERILERQLFNASLEGLIAGEKKKVILRRHHDAQRLLDPIHVVLPFRIRFPKGQLILRRELKKYLTLLKSIALLHQHQRPRKTIRGENGKPVEYIEVTEKDVEIARPLEPVILKRNLDELAPPARSLYVAMRDLARAKKSATSNTAPSSAGVTGEVRRPGVARRYVLRPIEDDVDESLALERREIQRGTGLSLWHIKTYMPQLVEYEYVVQLSGSKGKRCRYLVLDVEEPEELEL